MEENNKKTEEFDFPVRMQSFNFTLEELEAIKNEALINPFRAIKMTDSSFDKTFAKLIEFLNNEKFFNSIKREVFESVSKGENFLDKSYSIKYRLSANKEDQEFSKTYQEISDTYLTQQMNILYSPINLNDKFEEYICSGFSNLINNYFHEKENSNINIGVTSFQVSGSSEIIFTFGIQAFMKK